MIRMHFFAILAICAIGCGIDLDPCTYEVGETLELVAQEIGFSSTKRLIAIQKNTLPIFQLVFRFRMR